MANTYAGKGFSVALGLFVVLLAGYAFLQSPFFALERIELIGNAYVQVDDVLDVSALRYGVNLIQIDLKEVTESIRTLPVVVDVKVSRRLPSSLRVRLVERSPIAYLASNSGFWTVDAEGVVVYPVQTLSKPIPVITATPPVEPMPGQRVDEPHLMSALRFAGALTLKGLAQLSEIHASPAGITAYTTDRVTVNLGVDGDMAEKAAVLEALLDKAAQGNIGITHVDVRHPRSPVVEQKR